MVTGGNGGIGLEICLELARQGFNIIIVSKSEEGMEQAATLIKE